MKELELEKVYNEKGQYLGRIWCYEEDLTPERIKEIKEDTEDVLLWRKYWPILDTKIRTKWRAVKID